jgi:hypothetical protein
VDRGDDHIRPEGRSVLTQAPTFVLESALFRGDLELMLWETAVDGLLRVKTREMLADDFIGFVAL